MYYLGVILLCVVAYAAGAAWIYPHVLPDRLKPPVTRAISEMWVHVCTTLLSVVALAWLARVLRDAGGADDW